MLKKLLGSQMRIDLLRLFIFNPKEEYFARQLHRITKDTFETVRKELLNLESTGLLRSRISGRQRYYSVDSGHPLFSDLKAIIFKTIGIGDTIKTAISGKNGIYSAFIYGSYAHDTENAASDVDIFVIGDISSKDLGDIISPIEERSLREINYVNFSEKELKEKLKKKNNFIMNVLKGPKIFLKGDENDLRKLG